jgi:hypothetical protein
MMNIQYPAPIKTNLSGDVNDMPISLAEAEAQFSASLDAIARLIAVEYVTNLSPTQTHVS